MTAREDRRQRLEGLMQRAFDEVPPRRAPATLERRVLWEIEQRTLRPWRRGFAHWPRTARAVLIVSCCASLALVLLGSREIMTRLAALLAGSGIAGHWESLRRTGAAAASLGAVALEVLRAIPTEWLLGGLLATALLYAAPFALAALGYSTLYATPERPGARPT